jgi:uronate dehydrogenase
LASLREASAVIHLGASLAEDDWTPILQANIVGAYNVFEAARQCQVARIVYASSHHVSGMYPTTQRLDTLAPTRPDSLYGLSKTFGEQLGQYYWDKYGLESVGLRIGSVRPKPEQTRELFTWLSECDYCRLIDACLTASRVDHTLVWGVSGNGANWWDNAQASHLGFFPRDSADASTVKASDDDAALLRFQGGKRSLHGFSRKVP